MQRLALPVMLATLSACASHVEIAPLPEPPELVAEPQTGWRAIATPEDADRIDRLPATWKSALAAAQRYRSQIGREGDLLVPDAARSHPTLPPGSYHCRLDKLGTAEGRDPPFQAFPAFFCYVRGDLGDTLFLSKQTGTELPGGWLHGDEGRRLVLTGAKQRPGGGKPLVYGEEADRDLVGVVERIGPFRWRLVLPWRGSRSGLDVYELIPVPLEQQAPEPLDEPDEPDGASPGE